MRIENKQRPLPLRSGIIGITMRKDQEHVAKCGDPRRVYTLENGNAYQLLRQLQEAGQAKTRAEIAAYITAQQRSAKDFERRAWLLFAMWNETRSQELFYAMVVAHWADATRYLQETPVPNEWTRGSERDQRLTRELLSWLGLSPLL